MFPLFDRFPRLRERLPHVPLTDLPTPVEPMLRLGAHLGLEHLYIKRDDLSGAVYGGNKVRKLEFLLGEALREGAKEVITFGFAGSNHAARHGHLRPPARAPRTSMLLPQPNAHYVRSQPAG